MTHPLGKWGLSLKYGDSPQNDDGPDSSIAKGGSILGNAQVHLTHCPSMGGQREDGVDVWLTISYTWEDI